jgi:carbon monoxide dehydrogenase subunit G
MVNKPHRLPTKVADFMRLSGTFSFDADQQAAWNVLMDPNAIAQAIPGVNELIPVEGENNAWRATAKIGIASVSGTYTGVVRMSDLEPIHQYRLTVSGEGQQSIINGTALMKLAYNQEQQKTILTWDAEANISGKLASIGQRLIGAAANMLSRQFFTAIAKQLPARQQPQA